MKFSEIMNENETPSFKLRQIYYDKNKKGYYVTGSDEGTESGKRDSGGALYFLNIDKSKTSIASTHLAVSNEFAAKDNGFIEAERSGSAKYPNNTIFYRGSSWHKIDPKILGKLKGGSSIQDQIEKIKK